MIASHASRPTTIHPLPLSRPAGTRLKDTAMSGGWPAWSPGATRTSGACDRPCAAVDSSTTQRCPRSARSRDGREETQRLHLNPKSGLLRASSSKNAKLFLTLGVCYRRGADGPLGRRSGFRYGRCRLLWLLRAVPRVCRSSAFASASGSVSRAMSRSWRSFERAWGVSSWPPPVGRGSWGSMPLAARHTAISRTRAVLG
jgi:hypothetical protein